MENRIKAQKGQIIKYFSATQWKNMNEEIKNHGWVIIGETPNSNPDVPEEILNHRMKIKSLEVKKEPEVKEEIQEPKQEVPGFEENIIDEQPKEKKKRGPKSNKYANKK